MDYFLFLLVNATLFIRPVEILPGLGDVRIYEFVILSCLAAGAFSVMAQFSGNSLETRPITLAVLGMWVLSFLCNIFQDGPALAAESAFAFFKIVVYYLLLVGIINTPSRLRGFLTVLYALAVCVALIAVLRFHGVIAIRAPVDATHDSTQKVGSESAKDPFAPAIYELVWNVEQGRNELVPRLRGTGIFSDPNDLCLPLAFGVILSVHAMLTPSIGSLRFLCVIPMGILLYAMQMTHSRGGILGMCCGLIVLFGGHYGWRKAGWLMVLLSPAALVLGGRRLLQFSATEGTGQARIQLWNEGLVMFKDSPLLGVGVGHYAGIASQEAHNSFIQAFAEMGIVGGMLFLGCFVFAGFALARMQNVQILDVTCQRILPAIMAVTAATAAGFWTLSRNYEVSTYTMLGLITAFLQVTPTYPPQSIRVDGVLLRRVAVSSFLFLAGMYFIVRFFGRYG